MAKLSSEVVFELLVALALDEGSVCSMIVGITGFTASSGRTFKFVVLGVSTKRTVVFGMVSCNLGRAKCLAVSIWV